MQKISIYKCPICSKPYKSINVWGKHLQEMHSGTIPEDWSIERYLYYVITGKTHGKCIVCKMPTEWNQVTQKYQRFCNDPKCKEKYREDFKKRMINKYGKVNLLDDPEHQRKMLASKKMSGKYLFSNDKKEVTYTGTYEKDFLMMLDKLFRFSGNDIMGPSPHTYYYDYVNQNDKENEGRKFFIPDFFIPSLNLEVEIKQSTNTHPKLEKIDKVKENLKDETLRNIKGVNYIKIVEKDYVEFFKLIDELSAPKIELVPVTESTHTVNIVEPDLKKLTYIPLTQELIDSSKYPEIKRSKMHNYPYRTGGEIILQDEAVYAVYQTRELGNQVWLLGVYFTKDIRDTRIERSLWLKILRRGKITNVSVDTDKEYLIELYKQYGFHVYSNKDSYVWMSNQTT